MKNVLNNHTVLLFQKRLKNFVMCESGGDCQDCNMSNEGAHNILHVELGMS